MRIKERKGRKEFTPKKVGRFTTDNATTVSAARADLRNAAP